MVEQLTISKRHLTTENLPEHLTIDLQRSGTRKEELPVSKENLNRLRVMRRVLNPLSPVEQMKVVLERLSKTKANSEFPASMQG